MEYLSVQFSNIKIWKTSNFDIDEQTERRKTVSVWTQKSRMGFKTYWKHFDIGPKTDKDQHLRPFCLENDAKLQFAI